MTGYGEVLFLVHSQQNPATWGTVIIDYTVIREKLPVLITPPFGQLDCAVLSHEDVHYDDYCRNFPRSLSFIILAT